MGTWGGVLSKGVGLCEECCGRSDRDHSNSNCGSELNVRTNLLAVIGGTENFEGTVVVAVVAAAFAVCAIQSGL